MNQVTASLGAARSLAIKKNRPVMLFLATVDPERPQDGERVVMQLAESTGQIHTRYTDIQWYDERYVPIVGLPAVELPEGVNVAGPVNTGYRELDCPSAGDGDDVWVTQPGGDWRNQAGQVYTQEIGRQIGVIFSPTGQVVTRNIQGGRVGVGHLAVLRRQFRSQGQYREPARLRGCTEVRRLRHDRRRARRLPGAVARRLRRQSFSRETQGDEGWEGEEGECDRIEAITNWVNRFGVPILFNRYTGIAEVYEGHDDASGRHLDEWGFSLIELLLAIFILGVGIISIAAVFPAGISSAASAQTTSSVRRSRNRRWALIRSRLSQDDFGTFEEFGFKPRSPS